MCIRFLLVLLASWLSSSAPSPLRLYTSGSTIDVTSSMDPYVEHRRSLRHKRDIDYRGRLKVTLHCNLSDTWRKVSPFAKNCNDSKYVVSAAFPTMSDGKLMKFEIVSGSSSDQKQLTASLINLLSKMRSFTNYPLYLIAKMPAVIPHGRSRRKVEGEIRQREKRANKKTTTTIVKRTKTTVKPITTATRKRETKTAEATAIPVTQPAEETESGSRIIYVITGVLLLIVVMIGAVVGLILVRRRDRRRLEDAALSQLRGSRPASGDDGSTDKQPPSAASTESTKGQPSAVKKQAQAPSVIKQAQPAGKQVVTASALKTLTKNKVSKA